MQLSFDLRMRPMSAGGRSATVSPRMLIGVLALCGEKSIGRARQFAEYGVCRIHPDADFHPG
jgi:hypothetical protein